MRIAHSLITTIALSFSTLLAIGCATSEDIYEEAEGEAASAGKLVFSQQSNGQFRFNLKSGNGSVLLTSEAYTSRTGAINGALSVLENGVDKAMYRINQTTTGFVLHLYAANGESISFSEVYSTKASATRALSSCVNAITSYLDKREAASTGKRVEVLVGETGKFRFNIHAANGEIVLSSEQYDSEAAALNGAFAVQAVAATASAYSVKQTASGEKFFFTVSAQNGQIVGVSQQYTTKASADAAVASLKKLLPTITVL